MGAPAEPGGRRDRGEDVTVLCIGIDLGSGKLHPDPTDQEMREGELHLAGRTSTIAHGSASLTSPSNDRSGSPGPGSGPEPAAT